jgi:hypothetical protein
MAFPPKGKPATLKPGEAQWISPLGVVDSKRQQQSDRTQDHAWEHKPSGRKPKYNHPYPKWIDPEDIAAGAGYFRSEDVERIVVHTGKKPTELGRQRLQDWLNESALFWHLHAKKEPPAKPDICKDEFLRRLTSVFKKAFGKPARINPRLKDGRNVFESPFSRFADAVLATTPALGPKFETAGHDIYEVLRPNSKRQKTKEK